MENLIRHIFMHNIKIIKQHLIEGEMPKRQVKFIAAWAELHKDELYANWEFAITEQPLYKIDPLK